MSAATSSRRIDCNSDAFMYLSRAARSSMRRMIFTVVSTPTSDEMSTSSRSSSTAASTVERPATARASFEKSPVLVFSSPASSSCRCCRTCSSEGGVSCFLRKISKNPILVIYTAKIARKFQKKRYICGI